MARIKQFSSIVCHADEKQRRFVKDTKHVAPFFPGFSFEKERRKKGKKEGGGVFPAKRVETYIAIIRKGRRDYSVKHENTISSSSRGKRETSKSP